LHYYYVANFILLILAYYISHRILKWPLKNILYISFLGLF
jgi:hypothetical protein